MLIFLYGVISRSVSVTSSTLEDFHETLSYS